MNVILFTPQDFISEQRIRLSGHRHQHILTVHRAEVGDTLRIGQLDGLLGKGVVVSIDDQQVTLEIALNTAPPEKLPLTLLLALPRPKMLKRILQNIATLGVDELYLINSYRVDKSYWSTPLLQPEQTQALLQAGLEQAVDTHMPTVHLRKRFKPFVEDELPALCQGKRALVAHPYDAAVCPPAQWTPTLLAIGPEGGFIPYEVEKLQAAGLEAIHLGARILRVETAVPALLSRLFPVV